MNYEIITNNHEFMMNNLNHSFILFTDNNKLYKIDSYIDIREISIKKFNYDDIYNIFNYNGWKNIFNTDYKILDIKNEEYNIYRIWD